MPKIELSLDEKLISYDLKMVSDTEFVIQKIGRDRGRFSEVTVYPMGDATERCAQCRSMTLGYKKELFPPVRKISNFIKKQAQEQGLEVKWHGLYCCDDKTKVRVGTVLQIRIRS